MEHPGLRTSPGARERILAASFELFGQKGIRDTGIDELIAKSGVAKATFYRNFASKDELVLAYLASWYQERCAAIAAAAAQRAEAGQPPLTAVFDVLDGCFQRGMVEVSSFLRVLLELGPEHPLGQATLRYLAGTREQVAALAKRAGLRDPEGFAWSFTILVRGAIVVSVEGDAQAGARAAEMALELIREHGGAAAPLAGEAQPFADSR